MKFSPAAGFLVLNCYPGIAEKRDDIKVLVLEPNPEIERYKQYEGMYDIPKGKIDEGESALECAVRELEEEAGIRLGADGDINTFHLQRLTIKNGNLTLSCAAVVDNVEKAAKIKANPETGKAEHVGYGWVTFDELCSNCIPTLADPIQQMISKIEEIYDIQN